MWSFYLYFLCPLLLISVIPVSRKTLCDTQVRENCNSLLLYLSPQFFFFFLTRITAPSSVTTQAERYNSLQTIFLTSDLLIFLINHYFYLQNFIIQNLNKCLPYPVSMLSIHKNLEDSKQASSFSFSAVRQNLCL